MKSTRTRSKSRHPHGRGQALRTRAIVAAAITAAVVIAGSVPVSAHAAELGSGSGTEDGRAVVKIEQGVLRGSSAGGVEAYLGIPYAAPPVGERRFAAPEAPERWPGVRSATSHAPACLQAGLATVTGVETSEDCLYLDVYRPDHNASPAGGGREDIGVLVWLHGGAFAAGSGALFDARELAERTNTVVVTMNYDWAHGVPGHSPRTDAGMPDCATDRRTGGVRENIPSSGGDPQRLLLRDNRPVRCRSVTLVSPRAEGSIAGGAPERSVHPSTLQRACSVHRGGRGVRDRAGLFDRYPSARVLARLDADSIMSTGGFFTPTYGVPTVPSSLKWRSHRSLASRPSPRRVDEVDYIGAVGALGETRRSNR